VNRHQAIPELAAATQIRRGQRLNSNGDGGTVPVA